MLPERIHWLCLSRIIIFHQNLRHTKSNNNNYQRVTISRKKKKKSKERKRIFYFYFHFYFYLEQSALAENNGSLRLMRPDKLGRALAFISLTENFFAKNLKHSLRAFSSDLFAASLATSPRATQQKRPGFAPPSNK